MAANRLVMLGGLGESTRIVYWRLATELGLRHIVLEDGMPRSQFLRRRMKKLGVRRALSQALFRAMLVPALRRYSRARIEELHRRVEPSIRPIPEDATIRVSSVNSDDCIFALRELAPRVIVIHGTRIISQQVLDAVPATFINLHAGLTPRYRGVHGAYWARAEGRPHAAGVTVHLVDKGIDTGSILGQALIHPDEHDNFVTLPYLQLEAGLPLLVRAVRDALNERLETVLPIDDAGSRLWHHPTVGEYVSNLIRRGAK
jgi:folate-dependent phosphoribosylglycinamide formyltransferase PurN